MSGILSFLYDFSISKLPYITIIVFVLGIFLRLRRFFSAPKDPLKENIDFIASIKFIILDVVLFRKTFKSDKFTWIVLFLFHASVAGIIFGHLRGFHIWSASIFAPFGEHVTDFMIHILPIYVGWIFIVTQIILLWRRFSLESTKLVSLPNDYIALILLLIKSVLGQGMRLFPYEAITSEFYDVIFIPRFVVLHLEKMPSYHWFNLHIIFTQLFIMYIPYSKIIHTITGVITSAIYGSRRKQFGI